MRIYAAHYIIFTHAHIDTPTHTHTCVRVFECVLYVCKISIWPRLSPTLTDYAGFIRIADKPHYRQGLCAATLNVGPACLAGLCVRVFD